MSNKLKADLELYYEVVDGVIFSAWKYTSYLPETAYDDIADSIHKFISSPASIVSVSKIAKELIRGISVNLPEISSQAHEVFKRKNEEYGGLWRDAGAVGAAVEMLQKMARLKNDKTNCDATIDLFNYAVIFLMCVQVNRIKPERETEAIVDGSEVDTSEYVRVSTKKYIKKVVMIDFDGTVAKYKGWNGKGPVAPLDPTHGCLKALEAFREAGWFIVINSCRGDAELIKGYMEVHNLPYDEVNTRPLNQLTHSDKPIAELYIDDRGYRFYGSWEPIMMELEQEHPFKPWWK